MKSINVLCAKSDDNYQSLTSKKSLLLVFLQVLIIFPLTLGYFLEVFIGLIVLVGLFLIINKFENNLLLLPLFIYMPIGFSFLMGIQLSELGILILFLMFLINMIFIDDQSKFVMPAALPISLFIIASLLSIINARYPKASIINILKIVEAFVLVFWIITNCIRNKEILKKILLMIVFSGIVASFYGFYQFLVGGEMTMGLDRRIFGLLGGGFGAFIGSSLICALSLILFSKSRYKILLLFCLPVLVTALVLHQTRAWYLATIVALIFVISQVERKRLVSSVLPILIVVGLISFAILGTHLLGLAPKAVTELATETSFQLGLSPTDNQGKFLSIMMRLFLWWKGFHIYMESPILGFGIGNLRFGNMLTGALGVPGEEGVGYIDNHYLNILYETGILGFASWIILLILIFRRSKSVIQMSQDPEWKAINFSIIGSLIIFFVGGIFWCLTVVHEMTIMVAFLMGLLFASHRIQERLKNT